MKVRELIIGDELIIVEAPRRVHGVHYTILIPHIF